MYSFDFDFATFVLLGCFIFRSANQNIWPIRTCRARLSAAGFIEKNNEFSRFPASFSSPGAGACTVFNPLPQQPAVLQIEQDKRCRSLHKVSTSRLTQLANGSAYSP